VVVKERNWEWGGENVRGLELGEEGGTQKKVESWKRRLKTRKRGMEQRIVSRIR